MDFQISKKAKMWTTLAMAVGVVLLIIGFLQGSEHGILMKEFLASLLTSSLFLFLITISMVFFMSLQYATEAGWSAYIKRPIEAITGFLPYAIGLLLVTFLALSFTKGSGIYLWMDSAITTKGSEHYDPVIAGKSGYLNFIFWWIRTITYFVVYYIIWNGFIKRSRMQDKMPERALELHLKNYRRGALFLVFFAVFSSSSAWDWIMAIEIHWYSTLFGWFVFSGGWITSMVVLVMLLYYIKKLGYMPQLNDSHIHDVGKWVFSVAFLWSYLWFSQFMLIWYANIPEEVAPYVLRIENFKVLYFTMFAVNFIFPMLILISRDAKRNAGILTFVGIIIIVFHWVNVWFMVAVGAMGPVAKIGCMEIGVALALLGFFVRIVLIKLASAPLVLANHPYLDESIHHDI